MAQVRYPATQTQSRVVGETLLDTLRQVPFGALPKAELELALFRAMITAGIINPSAPTFDLARALEITPARVRGLIYRYRLQTQGTDDETLAEITRALSRTRFELSAGSIVFGIEDPYLRDSFAALLKERGVFIDSGFNPETIRISVNGFVDFIDLRLGDAEKSQVLRSLTHDTHVEPSRFKRILKSTLAQLAKRIVGAAAEDVAADLVDTAWELTSGLLSGGLPQIERAAVHLPGD